MKYNTEKIYSSQKDIIERAKREGAIVLERNEEVDKNIIHTINIDEIYKEVDKLKNYVNNNKDIKIEETRCLYPYLHERYPKLFEIIHRRDNLEIVYNMLKSIEKIQKKEISYEDESKILGKKLAEKYIKK